MRGGYPYLRPLVWLLGALLLVLPSETSASPAISAEEFLASPAARAFKEGRYEQALSGFQQLLGQHPDDVVILRYIAITYERLERYPQAVATYEKALGLDPQSAALHLFLGITYFKLREAEQAKAAFRRTLALAPDSLYAQRAQEYLEVMERQAAQSERPGAPRAFEFSFQVGVQFDDNVPAAPRGGDGFAGDRDGLRFTQYLSAGYRLLQKGPWMAKAEVSAYQSEHVEGDLDDFDVSAFDGALEVTYATALGQKPLLPGVRYSYKPVLQHGDLFSESHSLTTSVNANLTARTTTRLFHRLTLDNFRDEGFDRPISSRDATNNAIGLTQYVFFAERRGYLWAGYDYQINEARGLNFDFRGHRGSVGLSTPPLFGVRLDVSAEYSREDYQNFQGPEKRRTNRWVYSAALSRRFWERFALSLAYYHAKEDSNIADLDYTRGIATLALAFTF